MEDNTHPSEEENTQTIQNDVPPADPVCRTTESLAPSESKEQKDVVAIPATESGDESVNMNQVNETVREQGKMRGPHATNAQGCILTEEDHRIPRTDMNSSTLADINGQESSDRIITPVDENISFAVMSTGHYPSSSQSYASNFDKPLTCAICRESVGTMSLRCSACSGKVHYPCTRLPAYQISNLTEKNRRFTCERCTTVKNALTDAVISQKPPSRSLTHNRPGVTVQYATSAVITDSCLVHDNSTMTTTCDVQEASTSTTAEECGLLPETTLKRLDVMESNLARLVEGLCRDIETGNAARTKTDLAASEARNRALQTENKALQQKFERLTREAKQAEERDTKHAADAGQAQERGNTATCECTEKLRIAASESIEQDAKLAEKESTIKTLQSKVSQRASGGGTISRARG